MILESAISPYNTETFISLFFSNMFTQEPTSEIEGSNISESTEVAIENVPLPKNEEIRSYLMDEEFAEIVESVAQDSAVIDLVKNNADTEAIEDAIFDAYSSEPVTMDTGAPFELNFLGGQFNFEDMESMEQAEDEASKYFVDLVIRNVRARLQSNPLYYENKKMDFAIHAFMDKFSHQKNVKDSHDPLDGDGVDEIMEQYVKPAIENIYDGKFGKANDLLGEEGEIFIKSQRLEAIYSIMRQYDPDWFKDGKNVSASVSKESIIEHIRNGINMFEGNLTDNEYQALEAYATEGDFEKPYPTSEESE